MTEENKNVKNFPTEGYLMIPKLRFPGFEKEWKSKKLGEIANFSKGKGISKSDIDENGKTECIRYGELYTFYEEVISEIKSKTNTDVSSLVLSEANDVIIPASGETQIDIATASCVLKSRVALGGDLNVIKTENNGVFLSYYLNSKKKLEIAKLSQGISVVHLYSSQLALLNLKLPQLEEQNKLADFLSLLNSRIQTQKKIIEQLETLMKASREKVFSQKLRFKDEQGNYFPDWDLTELKNVCFIIGGGTPDTQKSEFWNGNIQWFTPTEIKSNFVFKSDRTISELGLKNSSAKILPKGSILLTTRATIGEVAIAQEECTTNQGFQSLIVKENCNNVFLFYWIKENKFELIRRANGSTFPEISKSEIELIKISLPPLEEQTKIANFLSSIQEKIEMEKQILENLELQKKFLLANLFV
ncbi:restriction endonuclease subunit S [Chryseobacterium hispalense]|uniref:restriction endonuclease subunit S n=1 Tax=Chryseobacterium hispalense TaxID=1453492 RepID=UPI00391BC312